MHMDMVSNGSQTTGRRSQMCFLISRMAVGVYVFFWVGGGEDGEDVWNNKDWMVMMDGC